MKILPAKPLNLYLLTLSVFLFLNVSHSAYAQKQSVKKTTSGVWYLEHTPKNYQLRNEKFPVIIFLHGLGERGNGSEATRLVKRFGPPKHIENGHSMDFKVNGRTYNFIVISPQLPTSKGSWEPAMVDGIISHVIKNYKVDPDRIYLTGLSLGGGGCWSYAVSSYNKPNKIAAIAPVAGFLSASKSKKDTKYIADHNIPVWAFHNSGDKIVPMSMGKRAIDGLKSHKPKIAPKFTVYHSNSHNSWTNAYATNHSVHSPNLYEWLLSHKRNSTSESKPQPAKNVAPIADAGPDQSIVLPKNAAVLDARKSKDEDGSIKKYSWIKVSGPAAVIGYSGGAYTKATNLKEGQYIFELVVTDNKGATATDRVTILVIRKDKPKEEGHAEPIADKDTKRAHGLNYYYYHGSWSKVSELAKEKVVKKGVVPNFTLSPKKRESYFGFEFFGYIEIKKSGTYTFYLTSDEGSKLWIGSKEVVDNDGRHTKRERSGRISLQAGLYPIKVLFFERSKDDVLKVEYAGPGISRRNVPDNILYPTKGNNRQEVDSEESQPVASGEHGLHYRYYEGRWYSLPNFKNEKVLKGGVVPNFNVAPRNRNDQFGFEFEGWIEIKKAGTYTFYTASDDGSALWVAGKKIVNNDGLHGKKEKSGNIYLRAGKHAIKGAYFEYQGKEVFEVRYKGPGISKRTLPDNILYTVNDNARLANNSKSPSVDNDANIAVAPTGLQKTPVEIATYPNPVADILTVEMTGPAGEVATISLIDPLGRIIFTEQQTMDGPAQIFELDVSSLKVQPGMILLQIDAPGYQQKMIKLIKQ